MFLYPNIEKKIVYSIIFSRESFNNIYLAPLNLLAHTRTGKTVHYVTRKRPLRVHSHRCGWFWRLHASVIAHCIGRSRRNGCDLGLARRDNSSPSTPQNSPVRCATTTFDRRLIMDGGERAIRVDDDDDDERVRRLCIIRRAPATRLVGDEGTLEEITDVRGAARIAFLRRPVARSTAAR